MRYVTALVKKDGTLRLTNLNLSGVFGVVFERARALLVFRFRFEHLGQLAIVTRQLVREDVDVMADIAWVDRSVVILSRIITLLVVRLLRHFNLQSTLNTKRTQKNKH